MKGLGPSGFGTGSSEAACHPSDPSPEGSTLSMKQGPPSLRDVEIRHLPQFPCLATLWSERTGAASYCATGGGALSQQLPQAPHPPRGQT